MITSWVSEICPFNWKNKGRQRKSPGSIIGHKGKEKLSNLTVKLYQGREVHMRKTEKGYS